MTKIVIIGAGISGLAAANHLHKHGLEVKVLEARERVGGRICVHDSWGVPMAGGAHWIHGAENNPMIELAQQFSSPYAPYLANRSYTYKDGGEQVPPAVMADFSEEFEQSLGKAKLYALNAPQDCSLSSALAKFLPAIQNQDQATLFARELNFFENYMGEGYDKLSGRYWDISEPYSGANCIVLDAFSAVVQGLAKSCDIALNTAVQEIHYGSEKITIITNHEEYIADKVIVTLPLGVLKKEVVKFDPPLPFAKQQAVSAIGMGLFDIIGLQFPLAFWPEDGSSFFIFNTNESPTCNVYLNMQPFFQKPILYGYVGGATARKLEKFSQDEVIARIMQTLRSTFGSKVPEPDNFYMTHWEADPYSYGSYSYVAVGATTEDFMALADPIADRLYFAGEATNAHLYDATTHGAYLSGIREARRIIHALGRA